MSGLSAKQRFACEEQVMARGSVFETVHRFLPAAEADQALALEALFSSIRGITAQASDPGVALAKLGWWQSELGRAATEGSQHPVVQSIRETGVLAAIQPDLIAAYIAGVAADIDDEPLSSLEALRGRLTASVGLEALMTTGVAEDDASAEQLMSLAVASRLLSLICSLNRPGAETHWLPLDLVARLRLGDRRAGIPMESDAVQALAGQLAEFSLTLLPDDHPLEVLSRSQSAQLPGGRFLGVRAVVDRCGLRRITRKPAWVQIRNGARATPGDMFAAWSASRRYGVDSPQNR